MNMYSIRVELHDATRDDYAELAENLSNSGIIDIITCDQGSQFDKAERLLLRKYRRWLKALKNSASTTCGRKQQMTQQMVEARKQREIYWAMKAFARPSVTI